MSIEGLLLRKDEFKKGIEILIEHKSKKKAFMKCAEEAGELNLAIVQAYNKPSDEDEEHIIEELVDIQMHIILMQRYFNPILINRKVNEKIKKMVESKDFQKYVEKANQIG
jgi:phosphoribosyl-ATP pyrophosphohydrolase